MNIDDIFDQLIVFGQKHIEMETTVKALSDIVKNLKRDIAEYQQRIATIESKQISLSRTLSEKEMTTSRPEGARIERIERPTSLFDRTRIAPAADTAQIERLQNELERERRENLNYRYRINTLEAELQKLKEEKKATADGIVARSHDPVSVFNNWAEDPSLPLPEEFMFLAGSIKLREKQILSESNVETAWIINREGEKYLFPNPRLLHDRLDITAYYTNGSGFKPKGQNKIRIKKPCKMEISGFIRWPGELELL